MQIANLYGLVGRNIAYSFSKTYFQKKFEKEKISNHLYVNFDLQSLEKLQQDVLDKYPNLKGFNVTIPYKQEIFDYVEEVGQEAKAIKAINTIKIGNGKLKGYNTDYYGFRETLLPLLKSHHQKALILGTGGSSKAVAYALKSLQITYTFVSRTTKTNVFTYDELTKEHFEDYTIIINCSPLGMHLDAASKPPIPYAYLNHKHLLYDLIYNPSQTTFLKLGEAQQATTCNGLKMLYLQADKAWEIWNKKD